MSDDNTRPRRKPLKPGGVAAALAHLLLLANTVRLIIAAPAGEWTQHWVIFLALDFPVSLGVMPVTWLVPPAPAGPLHDLTNFWWPLTYHALIGTIWWYIVGAHIQERIRARARSRVESRVQARTESQSESQSESEERDT